MEKRARRRSAYSRGARSGGRRRRWSLGPVSLLLASVACASACVLLGQLLEELLTPDDLLGVRVLPRSSWAAAPPRGSSEGLGRVRSITIHHEGGGVQGDFGREASARAIRAIQRYHQRDKGWVDIAYHYVVDRGGRIWQGRLASQVGAHAGSPAANRGNIGVLLLGNFDLQVPSGSQLHGLRELLDALTKRLGIPRSRVRGHREARSMAGLGSTRCPGRYLEGWLAEYRKA